jgi:hypothetical protein
MKIHLNSLYSDLLISAALPPVFRSSNRHDFNSYALCICVYDQAGRVAVGVAIEVEFVEEIRGGSVVGSVITVSILQIC